MIPRLDLMRHRFMVFDNKGQIQGMFSSLRCAQDTISYRPALPGGGNSWYVVDYVTSKTYGKGQYV
jgi:hypothetical protein